MKKSEEIIKNSMENIKGPIYKGTEEDFNKYLSGFSRNRVQQITKKYKLEVGKCEHCDAQSKELDAAHVHSKERKQIISSIINEFTIGGIVEIELNEYERRFLQAHEPIDETFKILCKPCHRAYDKSQDKKSSIKKSPDKKYPDKKSLIKMIKDQLQISVDLNKLSLSRIHKTGLHSVHSNKNCPRSDWHLCLINNKNKIINYFIIPKESNVYSKLSVRADTDRFLLEFEPTDQFFIELSSKESFKEYLKKSFPYKDF